MALAQGWSAPADARFAVSADQVTKTFGLVRAVSQVSLRVLPGEIWGLVGPNGSGKTTLLRCLCGLIRMDSGRASLFGHDVVHDHVEAVRSLAFAPELPHPFPNLTPFEHLLFVARAFQVPPGWEPRAEAILRDLDLVEKRDRLCQELSKGQQQKVHLAMAMLRDPKVILLDEPLIGLDPKAAYRLKQWIRERAASGAAVLVSSHTLSFVEEICSRVAVMGNGRFLAVGTIPELRSATRSAVGTPFEQIFLKITEPG